MSWGGQNILSPSHIFEWGVRYPPPPLPTPLPIGIYNTPESIVLKTADGQTL